MQEFQLIATFYCYTKAAFVLKISIFSDKKLKHERCVNKHYAKDASHSIHTREGLWSGPLCPRYKRKVAGRK